MPPYPRSTPCPVPRSSTCSIGLPATKALIGLLLAFVTVAPLDFPALPPRHRLQLPSHPSSLHVIRLVLITPLVRIGCLQFVLFVTESIVFYSSSVWALASSAQVLSFPAPLHLLVFP